MRQADANRSTLGFFPASVYQEFARNDHLYVVVENNDLGSRYAGHLLFDRRYPRANVRQMVHIFNISAGPD